jgi:hypothetical protein
MLEREGPLTGQDILERLRGYRVSITPFGSLSAAVRKRVAE